jgi:hypothetical protein
MKVNLKNILLMQLDDIFLLREAGLIGMELKPGLLSGNILVFSCEKGVGCVAVKLEDFIIKAKLVCPTKASDDELNEIIKAASHTLYKARKVEIDLNPYYGASECHCA